MVSAELFVFMFLLASASFNYGLYSARKTRDIVIICQSHQGDENPAIVRFDSRYDFESYCKTYDRANVKLPMSRKVLDKIFEGD